jgi:hypothetical protein
MKEFGVPNFIVYHKDQEWTLSVYLPDSIYGKRNDTDSEVRQSTRELICEIIRNEARNQKAAGESLVQTFRDSEPLDYFRIEFYPNSRIDLLERRNNDNLRYKRGNDFS